MAEHWIGLSNYAGMAPRRSIKKVLAHYPKRLQNPASALVWGSFGENTRFVREFVAMYPRVLLEIHISNECARRSNRSEEGKPIAWRLSNAAYAAALEDGRLHELIESRLDIISATLDPHIKDNTVIYLSSGLEIAITSEKALTNLHKIMRHWIESQSGPWAKAHIVYSPMDPPKGYYGADHIEAHAQGCYVGQPGADIWNLDGCDLDFGASRFFESIKAEAVLKKYIDHKPHVLLLWFADQQGLRGVENWSHGMPYAGRKYYFPASIATATRKFLLQLQGQL